MIVSLPPCTTVWSRLVIALLLVGLMVAVSSRANAADIKKGQEAFKAGDYETAFAEWLPLAKAGDPAAQNLLAGLYYNGQGVTESRVKAVRWVMRSANQGFAEAQNNLGMLHKLGRGVRKSDAKAVEWFRRSADQGYDWAQYNLGNMYLNGRGVLKDYTEATKLYRAAALQGHAKAQHNLAKNYTMELGVQQNLVAAHKWYTLAASNGLQRLGRKRDLIAIEMPVWAVKKSIRLAERCLSSNYADCED